MREDLKTMAIEITHITKSFQETRALRDVSLTLEGGPIYGLLGNNGAGKSTLLNIITDRVRADGGTVRIDGTENRSDEALSKVFLVGEQNFFPEDMRVKKALRTVASFYPDFDMALAERTAELFGLNLKQKITSLSTGYGSIFRIVLGLAVNTPYLFFDEPVLGLDAQHRELFYRLVLEKYAEHPCAVVLSTHLIAEAANLIDYAFIIRSGAILRQGPTEELMEGAYTVSGPAAAMEQYLSGRHVLSETALGGLKTACVQGQPDLLPDGLEIGGMNLQDYFISLMKEEDRK